MAVTANSVEKVGETYVVEGVEVYVDLTSGIETDQQLQAAAEQLAAAATAQLQAQAVANVPGYEQQQAEAPPTDTAESVNADNDTPSVNVDEPETADESNDEDV